MRITVEIADKDMKEICRYTGEMKKGTAVQRLVADALMLRRREEITRKFASGEWSLEMAGYDEAVEKDKARDAENRTRWRK